MTKFIAKLYDWNGEIVEQEIKAEWIDDIVSAVEGQYYFASNVDKFAIHGSKFRHVEIFKREVKENGN